MANEIEPRTDFIFYSSDDKNTPIKVRVIGENIWASQAEIAEIFNTSKQSISYHLKNIFNDRELEESSVVKEILTTASDQKKYNITYYNLDAIIAVGYRVNSYRATKFRQWATRILKEYLSKGFVLDDQRLKQGTQLFDKDYFEELLERIREIRASERRYYQKVTDLFSQTSYDYDKDSPLAQKFFATVQNTLEYAITGKTSAEIIRERANHQEMTMGLMTWKGQGQGKKILPSDVTIAKNYLLEEEIKGLNRLVNMFLDYAETQAEKQVRISMHDWTEKLYKFLEFYDYGILQGQGKIEKNQADQYAKNEFEKFRPIQDARYESDFDKIYHQVAINKTSEIENKTENENPHTSQFNENLKKALNYNPNDK